jgi:hypothetical protein
MGKVSRCTAAVLIAASGGAAAQSGPQATAAQLVQALVKQHETWESTLTSPGAAIRARESGRDGAVVRYQLYVTGLPSDRLYTVLSWPVNQAKPGSVMEGVSLGKDGLVSCTGKMEGECNDPSEEDHGAVDFAFNSLPGEPNRLALVNGDERAAIVIVPNPLEAKDKGCTVSVERLLSRFEVAYLTGSGYSPGAKVTFDSRSEGEKHAGDTMADGAGNIHFAMLPFVAGHQKGTTRVEVKQGNCAPSVTFDWGQ